MQLWKRLGEIEAMYDIIFDDGWWITKDGEVIEELGCFIDPISPQIIIKEMENEI